MPILQGLSGEKKELVNMKIIKIHTPYIRIAKKQYSTYQELVQFFKDNEIYTPKLYIAYRKEHPELVSSFPSWSQIHVGKQYPEFNWRDIRPEDWEPDLLPKKQYSTYQELVQFFKDNEIYTLKSYIDYRKEHPELVKAFPGWSDISSGKQYPEFNWGDIRPEGWERKPWGKQYSTYQELVQFFKDNEIYTGSQWTRFRSEHPELVKAFPNWGDISSKKPYPEFNWRDIRPEGWIRPQDPAGRWRVPYIDFASFLKSKNLLTWEAYTNYRKDHPEIHNKFPSMSVILRGDVYPEFNWGDIRPDDWRVKFKEFAPYEDFLQFVKENEIYGSGQWRQFRKNNPDLVKKFPSENWLYVEYPEFSWYDLRTLDTTIKPKPYSEFINFAISQRITSNKDWLEHCELNGVPEGMQLYPWLSYQGFNWSHVWSKMGLGARPLEQRDCGERYETNPAYLPKSSLSNWYEKHKTAENLQTALSKLQQPIMEFPQQEQQIAAFNLSRMKK